jgi:predicted regulator of Ras-like GTPase activity (Roadblock/LC7/MglB family)
MTAQTALWLSSCIAATLFFASGFLAHRRLHGGDGRARAAAPEASTPKAPALARVVELEREVERVRALEIELAGARSYAEQVEQDRARLEATLAARERVLAATGRERDEARRRLRKRDHDLRDLGDERDALSERARVAEGLEQAARRADAADAERQHLAMELEAARAKARDAESLREENASLRHRAAERDDLAARLALLRGELEELRARGLVVDRPRFRARGTPSPQGTGGALEKLLEPLANRAGLRAAAFADELGLPIVGLGEHSHGLAAFAGLADELAEKASSFLPVGPVRRIEIEGDHRLLVTAHLSPAEEARFSLVTMSVGALPPPELRHMLERSASLLA